MTTVTISLPESLKEFIDHQLATKRYGNVSEYFRSLLRDAQKEEAEDRPVSYTHLDVYKRQAVDRLGANPRHPGPRFQRALPRPAGGRGTRSHRERKE